MEFLCLQILNSNQIDFVTSKMQRDLLEDETWMRDLLMKWQIEASLPVPEAVLKEIKELREQMYSFLTGNNHDAGKINWILEKVSVGIRLNVREDKFDFNYTYSTTGWDLMLWHIARSFADMLCNHDLSRIKICHNTECGWVFYDMSKNRSRQWCSDKTCGNLMKVRRFRKRQKIDE